MIYGTASYYAHLRFEPATAIEQAAAVDAHRPAEATYLVGARRRARGRRAPRAPAPGLTMVDPAQTPADWPTILLARADAKDPTDLDAAVAAGAFDGLRRGDPRPRRRRATIAAIAASGLRGRGGAGYPAADKWRTAAATDADRAVRRRQRLRRRPGVAHRPDADAARPVRGHRGRGDRGLRHRRDRGVHRGPCRGHRRHRPAGGGHRRGRRCGLHRRRTSSGSGPTCGSRVRPVQGAYMLGEETVLLKALEGKRGQPEQRPPHPAERGLFDRPTVVHNVQTLAAVPWIVRNGADAFAATGSTRAARARSSSSSGRPAATASPRSRWARRCATSSSSVAQLPAGRSLKALLVGGPSGGLLPPDALDTPYDFEPLARGRRPPRLGLGGRRRRPDGPRRPGRRPDPVLRERGLRQDRSRAGSARGAWPRSSTRREDGLPPPDRRRSWRPTCRPTSSPRPCATTSAWRPSR